MAKHAAVATKLLHPGRRDSPLSTRLNRQVLQTIRDLATETKTDPGIEDEYEFELFGDPGPTTPKPKK